VRGTRAMLMEVLVNRGTAGGGLPLVGHHRGGSRAVRNNLASRLGPALTRGGRLWRLEEEVLGPVAPACGASAREWHCTTWRLDDGRRGERGGSVRRT
jgi:hypothetical protein